MILVFRRTGERRYSIEAQRPGFPALLMDPAPGYDNLMPHDMMHLIVESRLGLTRGVFGQLAAGGDAGTFHLPLQQTKSSRETARARSRIKARGAKLLREGRDESARSERATYICWYEWLRRSQSSELRKRASAMARNAAQVSNASGTAELHALKPEKLDEICSHLDHLSSHWSKLAVGQSMAVRWPDLVIVTTLHKNVITQ
jgi:hypothetical protein